MRSIVIAAGIRTHGDNNDLLAICKGDVFNVGTGIPTTICLITNIIRAEDSDRLHPTYKKRLEAEILESYADTRKSNRVLGFKFEYSLASGLSRMLSYTYSMHLRACIRVAAATLNLVPEAVEMLKSLARLGVRKDDLKTVARMIIENYKPQSKGRAVDRVEE